MDKFIIKGLCDKCGELLGTLKSAPPPAYVGASGNIYVRDTVLYHVADQFTKARVKCPTQ